MMIIIMRRDELQTRRKDKKIRNAEASKKYDKRWNEMK